MFILVIQYYESIVNSSDTTLKTVTYNCLLGPVPVQKQVERKLQPGSLAELWR